MEQKTLPFVSVIIPCRNEEAHIEKCLAAVLAQDYPPDRFEVIAVDGISQDGTRQIIGEMAQKDSRLKMIDNPHRFTPFALNLGIRAAAGRVIVLMGAHAEYQKDYLTKCVHYLFEYGADDVGGRMIALPRRKTLTGKAIVLALSHFFGAGNAYFRLETKKPKWVDTVFGGCYRREVFDRVGFFNEELTRGQDMEFNIRLKKSGGKILLVPDIVCYYYARSDFKSFFKHDFAGGAWVVYSRKFTRESLRLRHYLPALCFFAALTMLAFGFWQPVFWAVLAGLGLAYILISLFFSVKIATKERDWRLVLLMPLAFGSRHLAYALGSIRGLAKLALENKKPQN